MNDNAGTNVANTNSRFWVAAVAWLLVGFPHETTKFSYGAFICFALLSLSQNGWKQQDANQIASPKEI